ncbi:ATP-grasp fold amidoligase family protein [Alkalimonas sp. NCh-2]|uniref:ATP-grasp fold amidoligase family protein n=1 Tax=Alkalimonas sp. NCh-2 TaxID=3144846 RepID=UPI0031F63DC5
MDKTSVVQSLKVVVSKLTRFVGDVTFCKALFFIKNRRAINLDNPVSFSEKLYWLKLFGGLEHYSKYVDKVAVKDYVRSKQLESILIPTLAVYDCAEEFSLNSLPSRFVLKLNNASGYNLVVTDKTKFSEAQLRKMIAKWLKIDFYLITREQQYKPIKNQVIAEEFVEFGAEKALLDYKVYCFHGKPHMIQVISERSGLDQQHTYYDTDWNLLNLSRKEYPAGKAVSKPEKLSDMLHFAELLAPDFPFCRVDFYLVDNKVLFGEITFIPANANLNFLPASEDKRLASLIKLT